MMRRFSPVAIAAIVSLTPSLAHAFRTLADDPAYETSSPPRWASAEVIFDVHFDADAPLPARADDIARAALAVWQCEACSVPRLASAGPVSAPGAPGDGRNTISLVRSGWSSMGSGSDVGATTDLSLARSADGSWRIVEADIYVDLENHNWSLGGSRPGAPELEAGLIHEVGHALGLLHPCELTGDPACGPTHEASALYPVYRSAEISPSEDDLAGLRAIYPPCAECESDLCSAVCEGSSPCHECDGGGVRQSSCSDSSDCAGGRLCAMGPTAGICVAAGAEGAPCTRASDCATSLCLEGSAERPYCTRGCEADTECSAGTACDEVDGNSVCVPAPSGGCAIAAGRSDLSPWTLLLVCSLVFVRRRR